MEEQVNKSTPKPSVRRISTLAEHRELIKEVLQTAKQRVLIVSPFISSSALNSDGIPGKVRSATGRGVKVDVYTDNQLNRDGSGLLKRSAQAGISDLLHSGAKVTVVNGIHNKTLARDEDLIAEGSFNWLSAVRTRGGVHQREERTMVVEGEQAKGMIEGEVAMLESKKGIECGVGNHRKPVLILGKTLKLALKVVLVIICLGGGIGASWLLLRGHKIIGASLIVMIFAAFCWAMSRMDRGWFDDENHIGYAGALYEND